MVSLLRVQNSRHMRQMPYFLDFHDHKRRIWAVATTNNTHFEQLLNNFLNFILLGKGMMIRDNIGRKIAQEERNGMIMNTT
jgi:hypothetical protein